MNTSLETSNGRDWKIWLFAFGYFAAYIPYSSMTKALTQGRLGEKVGNFQLLPPSVIATVITMVAFITAMGWWKHASHSEVMGVSLPRPTRWTFLSGLCTGLIIVTTTMAYAINGVSIVFAMLLMRGGLLILAPIVDSVSKRHVRWFSWMGLALSLTSLLVVFSQPAKPGTSRFAFNLLLGTDIAIYLASYFVRLRFMSRLAKSAVRGTTLRYFVEEQMVAAPSILLLLGIFAAIGGNESFEDLRYGFTDIWSHKVIFVPVLIGFFSQFTGVFGTLILLDRRENSFAVPVNRCSSILAGVLSTTLIWLLFRSADPPARSPNPYEFLGAGLIVAAILFLSIPPMLEKKKESPEQAKQAN